VAAVGDAVSKELRHALSGFSATFATFYFAGGRGGELESPSSKDGNYCSGTLLLVPALAKAGWLRY